MSDDRKIARRRFITAGAGAALGGAALAGCAHAPAPAPATGKDRPAEETPPATRATPEEEQPPAEARIRKRNRLGRTGFSVSDISMGCGRISSPDVVRYAFDHGVNLLDTAEGYGNGDSERTIGAAMEHLRRDELFIVTKVKIDRETSAETVVNRLGECLKRMKTGRVDALYMHSVTDRSMVKHAGFHEAIRRLKEAGKVRHAGISSHGPRGKGDSMKDVLLDAVADGRFDLMLMVYNYLNAEQGGAVISAARDKDVGVTLMKVSPATLTLPTLDPKNLTERQERFVKLLAGRGKSREEAIAFIQKRYARLRAEQGKRQGDVDAFVARHGVKTEDDLAHKSMLWSLQNPGAHTVCVSMPDFDALQAYLPLSGTKLSAAGLRDLERHAAVAGQVHCRVGCAACAEACPRSLPASTVMRYAYYFQQQGREKLAMQKYLALTGGDDPCAGCDGRACAGACPHGVDVRLQLAMAHQLLSLA